MKRLTAIYITGLLTLVFSMIGSAVNAQDRIFLLNGNEVEVHVIKVEFEFILAKSTNPSDEHVYRYPRSEVVRIVYADGRVETFDEKPINDHEQDKEFVREHRGKEPTDSTIRKKAVRKKERLFYLGLGTGIDLPLGRYGSDNGYNDGFAKLGSFLNFESSILFSRTIGLSLNLGYANNKVKQSAIETKWELPTVSPYKGSVGAYNHIYLMLGPFMSIKTDKKLYVDLKVRWGLSLTTEPVYRFEYSGPADTLIKIDNINDSTNSSPIVFSPFTIDLGFAVRYNFSKRFGVMFQYDWFLIPMFYDSEQTIRKYKYGALVREDKKTIPIQEVASFNTIGFGVYFMILGPDK